MVTGWLGAAMVWGGVPAVRQDARGVVAQGGGFSLRINVVERPSLKDRAPDPNHKPDAALFEQATVMLKRAWPAYEALFHAVLTQPHPYRSTFQAHVARDGQTVTQAGEGLRTIILEKRAGIPITELRISGGGSQSDAAMQLTADIFGLPATRPHVYETSGLGAAIDAAVGLKLHPDFTTAVREMTRPGDVFEPNHRTHVMYDELYRRIYLRLYARLKPFYKDIRAIVGR